MALKVKGEDFVRKAGAIKKAVDVILPEKEGGSDVMGGINTFMLNLNSTMGQAAKLLQGYKEIKDIIKPGNKAQGQAVGGHTQAKTLPYTEPAAKPQSAQNQAEQPPNEAITQPQPMALSEAQKQEKAEALFNELHAMVKPHLLMAKTMSAAAVIQYALQPAMKKKIITEIAKRF